jgi:hypothetical protein
LNKPRKQVKKHGRKLRGNGARIIVKNTTLTCANGVWNTAKTAMSTCANGETAIQTNLASVSTGIVYVMM